MINILFEPLPTSVEVDGVDVPINTDFRACLRVILAFEDPELAVVEQQGIALANLYPDPPANGQAALERALWFLNGGEEDQEGDEGPGLRVYSFNQDANYIFAAFRQTHGVDLESVEVLHWWKFLALFMDLGENTTFCQIVGLRKRVKTGKATKEEKRLYQELRDTLELDEPERLTPEEREQEAEFYRLVQEGLKKREQATES